MMKSLPNVMQKTSSAFQVKVLNQTLGLESYKFFPTLTLIFISLYVTFLLDCNAVSCNETT